ncbi:MAG: FHA domain-containing protein [Gemmatimonadaceae bacterium]
MPRLMLLDEAGEVAREYPLDRDETLIGRSGGDVRFADDQSVAPQHAIIRRDADGVRIRDLTPEGGIKGTTWFFIRDAYVLEDADLMLLGSQVIRYRRLTPTEGQGTGVVEAAGSRVPTNDVGVLEQILANGTTRDTCYVPQGGAILIGREHGNWAFPYDPTMSARHAEVRSRPDTGDVVVRDAGSRNGIGIALRAEHALLDGDRLLLGRQLLRIDLQ